MRGLPPSLIVHALALLALLALTACGSTSLQAASPQAGGRPKAAATDVDAHRPGYTAADIRFMQGMIAHHAQAVRMGSLVPTRTTNESLRLLARRISISQRDEIALMQRWLRRRGQQVPHPDFTYSPKGDHDKPIMHGRSMDASHGALMPGMLTPEQMAQLAKASGVAFDRLFLKGMIQHHKGALAMVEELFGTRGAAQNPATFELATEISGVQRAQIARMRALLAALPAGTPNR